MKRVIMSSMILWGLSVFGGDGTLPFGDGTLPFGMEGIAVDIGNTIDPEIPLEVNFTEPEIIDPVTPVGPVSGQALATLSAEEITCPVGMDLYKVDGTIVFGLVTYDVVAICAVDSLAEGRQRLIFGVSTSDEAILLDGTLEENTLGEDEFSGVVKTGFEIEVPRSFEFKML